MRSFTGMFDPGKGANCRPTEGGGGQSPQSAVSLLCLRGKGRHRFQLPTHAVGAQGSDSQLLESRLAARPQLGVRSQAALNLTLIEAPPPPCAPTAALSMVEVCGVYAKS
jgi:hypothetical protein